MHAMKAADGIWSKCYRWMSWIITGLAVIALGLMLRGALFAKTPSLAFTIASPEDGVTVSSPVQLAVTLKDTELGWPFTGRDHLHISVDGGPTRAVYESRVLSIPLAPGKHVIGVDLAGPIHASLLPPKYVHFTVR